ncbi:MAG: hypothetical protein J0M20_01425 [Burkholderiales bacterium]|nr:hypothetical protein [Burkholderiales bacterium]
MQRQLDALEAACLALPPRATTAQVACPIFGNKPHPAHTPPPPGLPPRLASALTELRTALTAPPTIGESWPFSDPPGMKAAHQRRVGGRTPSVGPSTVVRLVEMRRSGTSLRACARLLQLSLRTVSSILAGDHAACKSAQVTGRGIVFPVVSGSAEPFNGPQSVFARTGNTCRPLKGFSGLADRVATKGLD